MGHSTWAYVTAVIAGKRCHNQLSPNCVTYIKSSVSLDCTGYV